MAVVSTGYDYSIRKGLNEKGIDNSQIGWNPNTQTVTVGGKDFMKADKNYNNSAFTNQQNFSSAWDNYNKSLQQPALTGQTGQGWNQQQLTNAVTNPTLPDNRYTGQIDQQIAALMNMVNNQQPINPYSTPQYAAYAAQSARRAQEGTRAAQEAMGSAGFGRSTALGERAQGIQNAETAYLETQVIPQLLAAEEARRQQQFGNMYSLLDPLVGQQGYMDNRFQTERGNARDALDLLLSEDQRAFENQRTNRLDNLNAAMQVGDATGRLITPQTDWTGLYRQAANAGTPLNLQGQKFASDEAQRELDNQYRAEQAAIEQAYKDGQLSLDQARLALSQAQERRLAANAATDNELARERFEYEKEQDRLRGTDGEQPVKVQAKDSADNVVEAKSLLAEYSKGQALTYMQDPTVRSNFTDSDYKAMLAWVEANLQ